MHQSLNFDQLRNLNIGTVDFVSPSEIKVVLDTDAPQNTALNTGVPGLFPRINGFVLIPNEIGAVVGIISWLGTEHSNYPKRKGFKDYDLIDLPFPLRKMAVTPIGTLKAEVKDRTTYYKLERGVYSFPSVGDAVILPKDEQLKAVVENDDERAFVKIGTAPIAGNAAVRINPNKLFGRHVAVLGNTGSGKSCTTAGLIRWSLEEAELRKKDGLKNLNARFVILDPNGEYSTCFDGLNVPIKRFKVEISPKDAGTSIQLTVPAWLWNSYEWASFTQATAKTQKPVLRRALRELRNGVEDSTESKLLHIYRHLLSCLVSINNDLTIGVSSFSEKPGRSEFGRKLKSFSSDISTLIGKVEGTVNTDLGILASELNTIARSKEKSFNKDGEEITYFEAFSLEEVENAKRAIETFIATLSISSSTQHLNEDIPVPFDVDQLAPYVERIAKEQGMTQFMDFLVMRIKSLTSDTRMRGVIKPDATITLEEWLEQYVSGITIIDLSLVPADIVHIIVAVVSRITFEAVQRFRRKYERLLPTVLTLEEAHNFIKKYNHVSDDISPMDICSQTFERIAKEGRKFGMSLVISSQRPSELSDTVLSQCNTFLLHRIVNDRDQDLVKRLVPDNIGGLLKELPILPTRKAILLGWASPIPILVEMNALSVQHCPQSSDPDFWSIWTGTSETAADWEEIALEWQGKVRLNETDLPDKTDDKKALHNGD